MSDNTGRLSIPRTLVVAALALGIVGGSYGIASAATHSSTTSTASSTAATLGTLSAPSGGQPWGGQRSDETPLTGDALGKVKAVALAKVSGGTIVRVETDADGHADYEAHMTDASGKSVTVYVNKAFDFVSVESR
jgi:hypothetical protein